MAGRANANVSLAASGPFVAAVWSAAVQNGPTDVFAAVSRDGGSTFSNPVRVNSTIGQVSVNGEQPPRVALTSRAGQANPAITVVWTAKGQGGTVVLVSRSDDGGLSYRKSAPVPGGEAAGNRGWEGVTVDDRGRVGVAWLDHRAMASSGSSAPHQHGATSTSPSAATAASSAAPKRDGVAMAQQSRLYYSVVDDPNSIRPLTAGVCYCCKVALAAGRGNYLALAWRHVYPGSFRDIAFSVSRDGGKTFASPLRVSEDKWILEGCPDDGPSMAIDGKDVAHVVWPTLVTAAGSPTIGLYYASSRDGRTFSPRSQLPTEGVPHHPQIADASDGSLAVVWDELINANRRIVFSRISQGADGRPGFSRQVVSGNDPALYPMVVASGTHFVTAWTSGAPADSVIRIDRR